MTISIPLDAPWWHKCSLYTGARRNTYKLKRKLTTEANELTSSHMSVIIEHIAFKTSELCHVFSKVRLIWGKPFNYKDARCKQTVWPFVMESCFGSSYECFVRIQCTDKAQNVRKQKHERFVCWNKNKNILHSTWADKVQYVWELTMRTVDVSVSGPDLITTTTKSILCTMSCVLPLSHL